MIRNILIQSAIRTAVVVVAFTISTTGAWAENDAPEQLDLANFPGEIVDKVVVPIPAEIFAVLTNLVNPNGRTAFPFWRNNLRRTTERSLRSLSDR